MKKTLVQCILAKLQNNLLEGGASNLRLAVLRFTTISSHFVANYIDIFQKTEVYTVILRCWTGLYLIWFKSYATNTKNEKKQRKCKKHEKHYTNECFFTKSQKSRNRNICVLCHNFWPNYNLNLLSTSKWPSELQFCERYVCIWRKFGWKWS